VINVTNYILTREVMILEDEKIKDKENITLKTRDMFFVSIILHVIAPKFFYHTTKNQSILVLKVNPSTEFSKRFVCNTEYIVVDHFDYFFRFIHRSQIIYL
jgi:hypothetical protein